MKRTFVSGSTAEWLYNAQNEANINPLETESSSTWGGDSVLIGFLAGLFVGTCVGVIAAALYGLADLR